MYVLSVLKLFQGRGYGKSLVAQALHSVGYRSGSAGEILPLLQ
jgi:ribosomal protein S18 acetylase RimI-like enzyme